MKPPEKKTRKNRTPACAQAQRTHPKRQAWSLYDGDHHIGHGAGVVCALETEDKFPWCFAAKQRNGRFPKKWVKQTFVWACIIREVL